MEIEVILKKIGMSSSKSNSKKNNTNIYINYNPYLELFGWCKSKEEERK
jgi:hypothetical protein